jgi:multidrug efflux pump subunit AcrB
MSPRHRHDLLGVFAQHKVACNLLMLIMILVGVWALDRLNTQFFPNIALDLVRVGVEWTGASAEDVEAAITDPLEQQLRTVDGLRQMTSNSAAGSASILLEYEEGTDMGVALDQAKEQVALVRNLPAAAETPEIARIVRYEPVARVVVTSTDTDIGELRALVQQMERELLDRGIANIQLVGLPAQEIAIQVPAAVLHELDLSLDDIANRVARLSRDIPAGVIGLNDVSRQLRALDQRRREVGFERLPVLSDESGRLLTLGDIATVERRPRRNQTVVTIDGKPAIEMRLKRNENANSLTSAKILEQWLEDSRDRWPPGVQVTVYDQAWLLIKERIQLLLKNGAGGLVLVVLILFLFLNGRVAFWVAAGIPISFMATLGVLYLIGGSINMVSLFGLIMALGIIVDDAIVVGEDALAHYQAGEHPLQAAEGGARRMLAPVISSSLTTIAAFLPLMLVSGIIGNVLFDIPMVVVCVIVASLVESFLVLPGHLRQAFENMHARPLSALRERIDAGFARFRDGRFRALVTTGVANPWTTISVAVALLLLSIGLFAGGRLAFNFLPTPEGKLLYASVGFVAGTPPGRTEAFLDRVEQAARDTDAALGGGLIEVATTHHGVIEGADGMRTQRGDQFGTVMVELVEPDARDVGNPAFIREWRNHLRLPAGIELFAVVERRPGPPGRDIDIRLTSPGIDTAQLKAAALELAGTLSTIRGVSGIDDDMPFGQEQLIYQLSAEGHALGLTVEDVGRQLRAAYDGRVAQIFQDGDDEIEVRVVLPDRERHNLASLGDLKIVIPGGGSVPLFTVLEISTRRGFDILRHKDRNLSVRVSAAVDPALNNSNDVIADLEAGPLEQLKSRYGVDYAYEGRRSDQTETLGDMARGGLLALAMIYLVLAWVFASYGWPLVVMSVIPFGIIGALLGHWLMGMDVTVLSLFGLFGLSGIVVNDSIILVMFYKQQKESGVPWRQAIVEATCLRLRAVLLTSLTTIAGLTPLMFETSRQAQFLIPMAVTISYGLAVATMLVLLVVPSLLCIHESVALRAGRPGATGVVPMDSTGTA